MDEITLKCLACGAKPVVPMADQYQLPDGTVVDASLLELPAGTIVRANDLAMTRQPTPCGITCRGCLAHVWQ